MALHVRGDDTARSVETQGETVVVDRHWCLTEDKSRVVPESDPAGRTLWASPGTEVLKSEAIRLGALTESEPEPEPEPDVEPEPEAEETAKERTPTANKQRRRTSTTK